MPNKGKVYLVGAGVGDKAYLTLRAKELLSCAEVLIYDALVDWRLLDLVPDDCLKINVGKRGGKVSTPQDNINQLLVAYCCQGKQVVRLKSGDPGVFGRSRAEIEALRQANCKFELVPGISSALAAPLLAGIPLTDRDLSSCFAVCTGHQIQQLNWQALAQIDTLVILMGTRSLPEIVSQLIAQGRDSAEPVAIIRNCSQIGEEVFWGKLRDIVKITQGVSLAPAVIVIGKTVTLSDRLNQTSLTSNNLPLANKTILVTRAAEQSSKFTTLLESQGAAVREMPALVITPPSSWHDLDRAIKDLQSFAWLILTSANGVKYFWSRLKDVRQLAKTKIAVVGKKTAATLEQYHIQPDFIPPNFVADSLVETFPEPLAGKKILFPRVETGGRAVLVKELTAQGASVVEVPAYESRCPETMDFHVSNALQNKQIDIVTFASSKTVRNFYQLLQQQLTADTQVKDILQDIAIASIGPQTSKTCYELLGRVDIEAETYTLEGLTEAIMQYKGNRQ